MRAIRCYCCDIPVSPESLDKKTGRYYCTECFSWTNEVILFLDDKSEREFFSTDQVSTHNQPGEVSLSELEDFELTFIPEEEREYDE